MIRSFPVIIALAVFAPAPAAAPAPARAQTLPASQPAVARDDRGADIEAKLQPILASFKERAGFPGGGIGFVLADGTTGAIAVGDADVENKIPMSIGHRLPAGSQGKTFFSAIAMQLVESGRLNLNAPLSKHLGDRAWFKRLPNAETITIRMLMNHTSGVPEHVQMPAFTKALHDQPDKVWKPDELIAFVLDKPALFAAGEPGKWAYADTNYILLGMVIEQVTGEKAYDLVVRNILKPRGLADVQPQDRRELRGLACGYMTPERALIAIDNPRTLIDGRFFTNPQFEWCGGGFIATPRDLARWTHMLWSGDTILKENTREMMAEGVPAQTGRGHQYGLGVQIRPTSHGLTFGHGGYFPGSMTETAYFTEHGFALAIMVNSDHHTSPRSLMQCLDECAGAIVKPIEP